SERLAKLAGACAERMGLSRDEAAAVRLGAILHDVGKNGIPDRILRQSMALTEDEMAWMRRHPQIGADIIGPVEGLHHVAPLIRHHHEKWDGTGYPKGLKAEEIPLGSRIISVADAFEAMVADRIYRPSLGLSKTLEEIKGGRGSHFDPRVVDAFLDMIATDTVHLPLPTKEQEQRPMPARPDQPDPHHAHPPRPLWPRRRAARTSTRRTGDPSSGGGADGTALRASRGPRA